MSKIFRKIATGFISGLPFITLAATSVTIPSPVSNIVEIINNFTGFFIGLSSFIAIGIVIYAGYLYMFSGGDPGKVQTAHKALLYTAIGYGIILLTWGGLIPLFKQIGGF